MLVMAMTPRSEALSLDAGALPLGDTLRIRGKGGKEREVPVLPAARDAVARYAALCPHDLAPGTPLFRGIRGGPLNGRRVAKETEQARLTPTLATPNPRKKYKNPRNFLLPFSYFSVKLA